MMLVKSLRQNNWPVIKKDILTTWPKIKSHELDQTEGNLKSIRKIIIEHYGNDGRILQNLNFIYQAALIDKKDTDYFDEDMEATMLNPSLEKISLHDLEMDMNK